MFSIQEERTFSPVDADVSFFGGTGIGHQHQTAPALERHPVLLPIRQPMRQSSARFHPGESHGMTDDPRRAADHLRYAEWTDPVSCCFFSACKNAIEIRD